MSRKLGKAINDNFDNGSLSLNSRLASANNGVDDFFSGDLNQVVTLINPVVQLEGSDQVTGLDAALANKQPLNANLTQLATLIPGTPGYVVMKTDGSFARRSFIGSTDIPMVNATGDGGDTSLSLSDTTVTPGSYGSATQTSTITVDQKGRLTAASNTTIAITGSQVTQETNAQTGTTYTFVLADAGKLVTFTNASAVSVTVPPNSSVAFPVNTIIDLASLGAGQVTLLPGVLVTVNSYLQLKKLNQYAGATLKKIATNEWLLIGNLA